MTEIEEKHFIGFFLLLYKIHRDLKRPKVKICELANVLKQIIKGKEQ